MHRSWRTALAVIIGAAACVVDLCCLLRVLIGLVLVNDADLAEFTPGIPSHADGVDAGGAVSLVGFRPLRMREGVGSALLYEGVPDGSLLGASRLWSYACSCDIDVSSDCSGCCVMMGSFVIRYLRGMMWRLPSDVRMASNSRAWSWPSTMPCPCSGASSLETCGSGLCQRTCDLMGKEYMEIRLVGPGGGGKSE